MSPISGPMNETEHVSNHGVGSSVEITKLHPGEKGMGEARPPGNANQKAHDKFSLTPTQLHKLLETRTVSSLGDLGGITGIAAGLRSDLDTGLSLDEDVLDNDIEQQVVGTTSNVYKESKSKPADHTANKDATTSQAHNYNGYRDRRNAFGENRLPKPKRKSYLQLAWMAFNDKLIFLLTASATISLALGIYEAVVGGHDDGSNLEWVESVTIMVAIVVIVLVSATNDYHKNHCFEKLNRKNNERWVTVIRSGRNQKVSVFDILVGDLLRLEAGDIVPVDGLLCQGSGVHCDESSITGESEIVQKTPATKKASSGENDVFIFSGTRIVQGVGCLLVIAVGPNSMHGKMQLSLRAEVQETPLQRKLGKLAKYIIIVGFCTGTVFFLITFIRWLVRLKYLEGTSEEKGKSFLDVFMLSVTVVLIGVPEGLSLAVAVALAFATTRMLRDQNLVRLLRSCEIMGNATTICSDKTGTLTQNQMSVVAGVLGTTSINKDGSWAIETSSDGLQNPTSKNTLISAVQAASSTVNALLRASCAVNSTAFEQAGIDGSEYLGSSTETALLRFAREALGMGPVAEERHNTEVVEMLPFNPLRKWMATVIKIKGRYRMLVKGAAEILINESSHILEDLSQDLNHVAVDKVHQDRFLHITETYASELLRPIAIGYRDLESWPQIDDSGKPIKFEQLLRQSLTLVGVLGIRDPLRPEVVGAVKACQAAGVFVRMVTGDNFVTAKAIASECGIYTAGGIAMDGPTFRKLTSEQLDQVVPRLQVLARSSPDDKQVLVHHLKKQGETVAVTGDGTNDAFALKAADVGFAMGISGTDIAKEACSIVLMDDNFASIVKALAWGRAINDAAKKFIQFQFTINITAGILTIISALVGDVDSAVFAVIQLLWLNLIMDIFAALALATDYPTQTQMQRRPEPRSAPIVNLKMWKMILGQALYQLVVIFTLHYAGENFFTPGTHAKQLQTLVFNTYMFMQVFNQTNCRRVDNHLNVFEGIHKNPWFLAVQVITVGGQVAIILKGNTAFQVESLSAAQWGWCMLFGFLTLPVGVLIRSCPDRYVGIVGRKLKPLMWPIMKVTQILRKRRATKQSAKKGSQDVEADTVTSSTDVADSDEEHDEERRIRRIQWAKSNKKHAAPLEVPLSRRPSWANQLTSVNDHDVIEPIVPSGDQLGRNHEMPLDLEEALKAVQGSPEGSQICIEVHPQTSKDDPILYKGGLSGIPPSQDAGVLQYLKMS